MRLRHTHMEVAIGVWRAIVQYKQWAFIIFPLLHESPYQLIAGWKIASLKP